MRIHVTGYRLVRIAALPPCLLITAFQQPCSNFHSFNLVEVLLWGCHLDVLSSAMIHNCCLLPMDWVVVLQHILYYSWLLFLQASLCSAISSPVSVLPPQCRPVLVYHARPSLTLQKSGRGCNRCCLAYHDKLINQILLFHFEIAATPWLQCVRLLLVQF